MSGKCKGCTSWFGKEDEPLGECAMVGASTRIPERAQPVIVAKNPESTRFFTPPDYGCERFVRKGP